MRTRARLIAACLGVLTALAAPASARALPRTFFGIDPQTTVTEADAQYMSAGGIGSVRLPVPWAAVQPSQGAFDWTAVDATVATTARAGLHVLPFLYGTPGWLEGKPTTLPVGDPLEQNAWIAFVQAIVQRYGPGGVFWQEHGPLSASPLPEVPIRTWQIWNEVNFYYFAYPVSPHRYAKLLKITAPAIRSVDPGAKLLLSGLFGKPDQGGRQGMPAAAFLAKLYRTPGVGSVFDGVAVHPYAASLGALKQIVGQVHTVMARNHDRSPLYVTEIGWGSQNDPHVVAFEKGRAGQAQELTKAYRYLIAQRHRLRLGGIYWFSWKDISGACSYCDSVGLFKGGPGFTAKPAWKAFVKITGGAVRP